MLANVEASLFGGSRINKSNYGDAKLTIDAEKPLAGIATRNYRD